MLRSSQKGDHAAPELPKREAVLEHDSQDDDESEEEPVELVGKRRRTQVDYRRLNAEMFGDFESYEGEVTEDEDFSPRAEARASHDMS